LGGNGALAKRELQQQVKDADLAENQVLNEAQQSPGTARPASQIAETNPSPAGNSGTIAIGQTIEHVNAIAGNPTKVLDAGSRKIYVYTNGTK
jgi:hypothetical protein